MSSMIRNAERQYVAETTTAIHPDCDQPYLWDSTHGCFSCKCADPDDRLLDTRDICLEWDERWDFGAAGELISHRLTYPECPECGDALTSDDAEAGLIVHPECWAAWVS